MKFEPMRFYHGMSVIGDVEVVVRALKCGRCRFFGEEEEEMAEHNSKTHHGGLVCRRREGYGFV
jgi:hypothetical protein